MNSLYHTGGSLYLPDPKTCGLDREQLAQARELEPFLKQHDSRDHGRELRNRS
jgi:hypothetical protein